MGFVVSVKIEKPIPSAKAPENSWRWKDENVLFGANTVAYFQGQTCC